MTIPSYLFVLWTTTRLQRAHNVLARVVTQQRSRTFPLSSAELLKQLRWLPTEWRIRFKLATLTSKALHTYILVAHHYILPTFCSITNSRSQRAHHPLSYFRFHDSHDTTSLSAHVPSMSPLLDCVIPCRLIFANLKHFLHSDALWNSLRRLLKTHYFQPAYHAPILFETSALYKSFTYYLLTYLHLLT